MNSLSAKEKLFHKQLASLPKALIAYSGGVDSGFLLWSAYQLCKDNVLGVLADSPSLARSEYHAAIAFATRHHLPLQIIKTHEMADSNYTSNPLNRCYYCKHELFDNMKQFAQKNHFKTLCYGENFEDSPHNRPGHLAAKEFRVLTPLRDAQLTKSDIRQLAHKANLEIAEKVASPCLASRITHGVKVNAQRLKQVELGEEILRKEGFRIVRMRHRDTEAHIQVAPSETHRLMQYDMQKRLKDSILNLGFTSITFDKTGYQGTSLK
ncbi:MAG: ATP-dependent sacrificial sulfur transferase LarE [Verrucomicrobiota bacterium]